MIEARCVSCGKRYRLKGDPQAMDFLSLPCPECGGMLEIAAGTEGMEFEFLLDKPLALVFWEYPGDRTSFLKELAQAGYEVRPIKKAALLAQWLRFNPPSLVVFVCEEKEKLAPFLTILNKLPMPERRKIFVTWVTPGHKSLDPREAFLLSIELVVNAADLSRFVDILARGQKIWQDFYTPLTQTEEALEKDLACF